MASYITHKQMALETYEKLKQEKILKTEINQKLMTTFAHGIDLSNYNELTHTKKTQAFLLQFLKKVKEEKEQENASIMAMLFGHICHYFLDTTIHPYVYYIEKGTQPVKGQFINGHTLVECYLDSYFVKQRLQKSVFQFPINEYFTLVPIECRQALNELYLDVYHLNHVARNYQITLFFILLGQNALKYLYLNNQKICETVVSMERYLKTNYLTKEEIANESHKSWYHPVTGKESKASALDLYLNSIENACIAIEETNKYLYGKKSLETLKNYFPNISYNTGIDLEESQEMKYVRKQNT